MRWTGSYPLALALAGCSFAPGSAAATQTADAPAQVIDIDAGSDMGSAMGSNTQPTAAKCLADTTYTARPGSDHTYKRLTGNKNFDDAVDACYREGGYLVQVDDASENAFINATFSGENWVGASDQEIEKTFVSVRDKQPIPYSHWNNGEPNDSGGVEDCAKINSDGTWNDVQCSGETHTAICECDPQFTPHDPPACRTAAGSITVQGRRYFKYEGANALGWADAHAACAAMGASMIQISDDQENSWVQDGGKIDFDSDMWLGLSQNAAAWSWDDGTAYSYKKWDGADPVTIGQCTLQHQSNSAWVATDCTATHSYGCECAP